MDFDNVRGILKKCAEIIPRGSHVGRGIFSKIAWAWHRGIPRPTRGVISTLNVSEFKQRLKVNILEFQFFDVLQG